LRGAACAANDAADDGADTGAAANLRCVLTLGGFTLEGECVGPERIALPVDLHLGEANHQARTSFHAAGALDFGDVAMQRCAGWHDREAVDDHWLTQAG